MDNTIQNSLREYLAATGTTQADFSRKAGVDPVALYKFLRRESGNAIAERIFPYVHDYLVGRAPASSPKEEAHA